MPFSRKIWDLHNPANPVIYKPSRSRRDANKARTAASKNRTVTAVPYNIGETTLEEPCIAPSLPFSSALPQARVMNRISPTAKALCAGLVLTILQIVVAIFLRAPARSIQSRYHTHVEHDSRSFANIVDREYQASDPAGERKRIEVANASFYRPDPGQ